MIIKQNKELIIFCSILIYSLSSFLFVGQILFAPSDITLHNIHLKNMIEGETMVRPHFLYYLVLNILSFGSNNLYIIHAVSSLFLLPTLVLSKFFVIKRYYNKILNLSIKNIDKYCVFLSLAMLLIFNPPPGMTINFKMGQIPPNIWHNSTGIFLTPFLILLYSEGVNYLKLKKKQKIKHSSILFLLCFINVIIKPTFFMPFSLTFSIFLLIKNRLNKTFWLGIISLTGGFIPMIFQYFYFFSPDSGKGIAWSPFEVWNHYSDNLILSLLVSILFPFMYAIFNFKNIKNDTEKLFSVLLFIFGLMFFILFKQKETMLGQNFNKVATQTNIILHMVFIGNFAKDLIEKKWQWKEKILLSILSILIVSGVIYIIKMPLYGYF